MSFCLFMIFHHGGQPAARIGAEDDARLTGLLHGVPDLARAHVYTPSKAHDPFLDDGAPPRLALQLYFECIEALEAACAKNGPLSSLPAGFATLADCPLEWEIMLVREFPVPDPKIAAEPWCTYLVAYEGPAEDPNEWMHHYIAHHPPIMKTMPGIHELEIYTAVEAVAFLPGTHTKHLQRNKVSFDSPEALTAGLNSPAREEMRKDFHTFPKFTGKVTHFPMATRAIRPR